MQSVVEAPPREIVSIILCGGRGTRMLAHGRHKVCFEVGDRPAINRAIEVYESCGIRRHVIVVGAVGGQVVETVGPEHPNALFAYQVEPLGTGHAAKVGAHLLESLNYRGDVLVVAGDKVIEPVAIQQLIDTFYRTRADLAMLVTDRRRWPDAGLVLRRPTGEVAASIEPAEIRRARILADLLNRTRRGRPIAAEPLRRRILRDLRTESKAARALGPLWTALAADHPIPPDRLAALIDPADARVTADGRDLSPDEYDGACRDANLSVYLFRAPALYAGLAGLTRDNAQGEEYLTDAVNVLAGLRAPDGAPRFKIVPVDIEDPNYVLAFNNPEELLVIEDYLRTRGEAAVQAPARPAADRRALKPAARWIDLLERFAPAVQRALREVYGTDAVLLERKRRALLELVRRFARRFGADAEVVIARAPGRVNLMGRHIDHEGGHVNVMAIDREILLVAQPREDARLCLVNVTPGRGAEAEFSLADELAALDWEAWLSRAAQVGPREGVFTADWDRLILAAVLRLQSTFPRVRLSGMNAVMTSEIPPAGGLSSSSATVIAAAEAAVALNRLDVTANEMIDLCGEGEWYAGGRPSGGSHLAAVKFGRRGSVAHIRFHDFEVLDMVPLPAEAAVVICSSGAAVDQDEARRVFHQRRACYTLGLMLLKDRLPAYAALVEHLRDLMPDHLGVTLRQIYRALLSVPESMTGRGVMRLVGPRHRDEVSAVIGGQPPEARYPLRGVMLFGLGECERSRRCAELLRRGDLAAVGHLMRISHDGDRVAMFDQGPEARPFRTRLDDDYLKDLILDLASEDPDRVLRGQIYRQPGAYGCSTEEIDRLVDLALATEGVYGAQMAGAGLGGCVMVLCRPSAVARLARRLRRDYYRPRGLRPSITPCTPVQGAGILRV